VAVACSEQTRPHASPARLQELTACCWLCTREVKGLAHGDARLAVGGKDSCVTVLSLAASAAVLLLKGHTQPILDLASVASRPSLLASASLDGTVRLWELEIGECSQVLQVAGCSCVALHADGRTLYCGCSNGRLLEWAVGAAEGTPFPSSAEHPGHSHRVDALRALPGSRLVSKGSDGRIIVWSVGDGAPRQIASWRVPSADKTGRSFGATSDGAVLVLGSNTGDVLAYSADGRLLARLSPGKIRTPVLGCAIADNCQSVIACYAAGLVARWELVSEDGTTGEAPDAADE
jgi:WD40 repeat protein